MKLHRKLNYLEQPACLPQSTMPLPSPSYPTARHNKAKLSFLPWLFWWHFAIIAGLLSSVEPTNISCQCENMKQNTWFQIHKLLSSMSTVYEKARRGRNKQSLFSALIKTRASLIFSDSLNPPKLLYGLPCLFKNGFNILYSSFIALTQGSCTCLAFFAFRCCVWDCFTTSLPLERLCSSRSSWLRFRFLEWLWILSVLCFKTSKGPLNFSSNFDMLFLVYSFTKKCMLRFINNKFNELRQLISLFQEERWNPKVNGLLGIGILE